MASQTTTQPLHERLSKAAEVLQNAVDCRRAGLPPVVNIDMAEHALLVAEAAAALAPKPASIDTERG